jgi:hypothetical protein
MEGAPTEEIAPTGEIASTTELNMARLRKLMTDTTDQMEKGELKIKQLTDTYFEWLKLFNHFGSAVAIAFSGKLTYLFL